MLRTWNGRRRDERGAVAVMAALVSLVLVLVGALTVDLGNTWARRGDLQAQVDKAVLYAATYLPAVDSSTRLAVAKAAAYYVACHRVLGQDAVSDASYAGLPTSCPVLGAASPTLDAVAQTMMSAGAVSFPTSTQVALTSPRAQIDFGFGQAAGLRNTVQVKTATAQVFSPGSVLPMGASLGCLAAQANNTSLAGIGDLLSSLVPINYFSAGSGTSTFGGAQSGNSGSLTWPSSPATATAPATITVDSATLTGTSVTVRYTTTSGITGLLAPTIGSFFSALANPNVTVWFGRGSNQVAASVPTLVQGTATLTLPQQVQANPGGWQVKVLAPVPRYTANRAPLTNILLGYTYTGSYVAQTSNAVPLDVPAASAGDLGDLDGVLSCAEPVVSPRADTLDESTAMIRNLRAGLDHPLSSNPSLATIAQTLPTPSTMTLGSLVSRLTTDPSGLAFGCGSSAPNVLDTAANRALRPNCVRVSSQRSWSYEFTQGFLTPSGRLSCSVGTCRSGKSFSGSELGLSGTYNDDQVGDFLTGNSPLHDLLFVGLDTYLTSSIPLLTPNDAVSPAIYSSPRFFWAPVLTTVYTTGTDASYPVLTFRPAFLTQEQPDITPSQKLLNGLVLDRLGKLRSASANGISSILGLGSVSGLIGALTPTTTTASLFSTLGAGSDKEAHGLVVDTSADADHRLKALRVMTLNPGALPTVDATYTGPVSDYLGSGPRVTRLVR